MRAEIDIHVFSCRFAHMYVYMFIYVHRIMDMYTPEPDKVQKFLYVWDFGIVDPNGTLYIKSVRFK